MILSYDQVVQLEKDIAAGQNDILIFDARPEKSYQAGHIGAAHSLGFNTF